MRRYIEISMPPPLKSNEVDSFQSFTISLLSKRSIDIIYHKGDFGKEPMIIVFAETPDIVVKKILKII